MKTHLSRRISLLYLILIKLLERLSYYGFRSIIVLYAINETVGLELSNEVALSYYGSLTLLVSVLPLPMGALSDKWLGNRNGTLYGLLVATLGCGIVAVGGFAATVIGCILIVIGSSLSSVNLPILIGNHFLRKDRRRNLAFVLLYVGINMGAFIGALLLGWLAEEYSFQYGFSTAAMALLLAIILFFSIQKRLPLVVHSGEEKEKDETILDAEFANPVFETTQKSSDNAIIAVLIISSINGLFWWAYEVYGSVFYEQTAEIEPLELLGIEIYRSWLYAFNSFSSIAALVIFFVVWWIRGVGNSIGKIAFACLLMAASLFLLQFAMNAPIEQFLNIALVPAILLGIAEVLIAPISTAYVTRLSNPKYAATTYGGFILILYLFSSIGGFFNDLIGNQYIMLTGGLMLLLGLGLWTTKKAFSKWNEGID
ncbi:MAG: MFS transporter [Saprospiraceae bacterium]